MKTLLAGVLLCGLTFGQDPHQNVPFDSSAGPTLGSDVPKVLVFVGGSYLRIHASGAEASQVVGAPDFAVGQHNLNFNLYGWHASVTENMTRWFGAEFDVSGHYGKPEPPFLCSAATVPIANACLADPSAPVGAPIITQLHTFMFGPRFTSRRHERIVPFAHVLLGVSHISGSLEHSAIFTPALPTLVVLPQNFSKSSTAFAATPGVGVDLVLNRRVAVRLVEIDYVMTRFYNQRQDNARASAGLVFQFGGR